MQDGAASDSGGLDDMLMLPLNRVSREIAGLSQMPIIEGGSIGAQGSRSSLE